jgi:glycosyltransferase involved in cell wall biosynthesis
MSERSPLRIGIDARELLGAPTGVGRYLSELLPRWTARSDGNRRRFVLYVPGSARDALERLPLGCPAGAVEVCGVNGAGGTWWEQVQLPVTAGRDSLDLFFAPAYTAPIRLRVPLVVAIHDVSYMAHPEWFPWRTGLRRRWLTRLSARRAARVLTCSEFSRQEIAAHTGVPPARIEVTPYGFGRPSAAPSAPGAVAREPVVLFAGSIFNRRHVPDLVRAFATVANRHPEARLVIAGENRSFPREDPERLARSLGVASRVEFHAYVPDAQLAGLYARARVFAFLSEYEGFGMTPLEALAAGVPVVVTDTPVAREVYGPSACYVRAGEVDDAAAAIDRLLTDEAERARLLAAAPAILARYRWEETADRTLQALERAAGGRA